MINYTEKGYGLHVAIRSEGHSLKNSNGLWVSSDDEAVQAIIDAYDPLQYEREQAYARIIKQADEAAEDLESSFPEIEKRTFIKQENEARAFALDPMSPTPTLSVIAAARGITVATLAGRVITKADYYTQAAASIIGARQRAEDLIDVETDWKVIQQINLVL